MSLFRNEAPQLGLGTTLQETSGYAGNPAGSPAVNAYKPTTRQIVESGFDGVRNAGALTGWLFVAPWQCQIVAAKVVTEVSATAAATIQAYVVPVASQPEAPSSGNQVFSAAQQLSSSTLTANTVFAQTLTTSTKNLILNAGDMIGYTISAAITSVIGGLLQIEVVQLG